ncbi:MAG: MFS transporter [Spirochaetales bacterium]|nr:MFS transporter [Spirochaetales bacterium]
MKDKNSLKAIIIILLVSFGHFWHDIFTAFVTPLMPVLKDNFGLSYLQTGWILIAVRIPSLLSANIAGYAEKHSPKWFVILCPLVTSISITLLGVAPNYYVILILVFISGLSAAGFHVPAPTLLKRSAPNRIGLAMTSFQIGGEAARTMGPLIVVLILSTIGLKNMYFLIPISILVSLGFYYSFKKIDVSLDPKDKKNGSIISTLKEGWWIFLLIGGISIHKSIITTLAKSFLPMFLQDSGYSLFKANGALSIVQGATVAGVIVGGIFIDRIGAKKILYIVLSTATIFTSMFIFIPSLPIYPMLVLIGFFSFASMPAIYTLIQGRGFNFPTTANGIFMSLNFGITSLMLIIAGKLSDMLTISTTYKVLGLGVLIGIPLIFMLFKTDVSENKEKTQQT